MVTNTPKFEVILKMFDAQIKHCAQFMGVVK